MNVTTWKAFRQQAYDCLERRPDALFGLCDGLLSEAQARSLPEISLSPCFDHTWSSVSAALADGKRDVAGLRELCVRSVLAEQPEGAPVWIAVDATSVARLEAQTSEDRGAIHLSNVPLCDKPISLGWSFSLGGVLPEQASSWTPPVEIQRIRTKETAIHVAIEQLRQLTPLCGKRKVIVLADRWYGTPEMLRACRELGYRVLIRLKKKRKLSRNPVRLHPKGPFPKDGALLQGTRPETQTEPQAQWEGTDAADRLTQVSRWDGVHFQQDRELVLSVLRVERHAARDTTRDPRVSWCLTLDDAVPLEQVPARSVLRFSEEQVLRFLKQDVLWTRAHVRTPEQFLRWSWIVALAFVQLSLVRELGRDALLPWEAKGRQVTPRQVRRVMPSLLSQVGTPTHPCQPRGKAPGRPKGFHPQLAPRYPVVYKTSQKQKKSKKTAPA